MSRESKHRMGVVAGVVSALIGAAVWAGITVATEYQIGWMAVAVGFLVGYAVRILGKGLSKNFGYVGAVCALLGCVLGNLLSICGFISIQESVPFLQIVVNLLTQSAVIFEILKATFAPWTSSSTASPSTRDTNSPFGR